MGTNMMESLLESVLLRFRFLFVCLFLMPLSLVFDIWLYGRNWIVFKMQSSPRRHAAKVEAIQKQVWKWNKAGRLNRMCTGRQGWQTTCLRQGNVVLLDSERHYKDHLTKISINLVDVITLDLQRETVKVEPLVTMGQLTATLVPLGWTIPVVPELDDLTIGGLVMGCGIETSSHKYGLFQEICIVYEVILPSGQLLHCSKDDNSELFYSIPWSHGTLCFLVAVELRIIPVKSYVRLTYKPHYTRNGYIDGFSEEVQKDSNEFVECLVYSGSQAVVMSGYMTDAVNPGQINRIGQFWKPWFFEHVKNILVAGEARTEYIPIRDYYHRHTKSLFWELQDIIPFGNSPAFRYLFGWMMPPKVSLLKMTTPKALLDLYERKHVIQDMLIPIQKLAQAIQFFDDTLKLYPLWLCPMKLFQRKGFVHPPGSSDEMYVDIGVYGNPRVAAFQGPVTVRQIEKFVHKHNGFQMLYADSYLTRGEFEAMFDHSLYHKLRRELGCEDAFPEVYDKVCRAARK